MARTAHVAAAALALLLLTGCGHRTAPQAAAPASVAAAPASATTGSGLAVLHVVVQGTEKRAAGYYTVEPADGSAATRKSFTTDSRGRWNSTVKAPPGATLRVALLNPLGRGTCTVTETFSPDNKPEHRLTSTVFDVSLCNVVAD